MQSEGSSIKRGSEAPASLAEPTVSERNKLCMAHSPSRGQGTSDHEAPSPQYGMALISSTIEIAEIRNPISFCSSSAGPGKAVGGIFHPHRRAAFPQASSLSFGGRRSHFHGGSGPGNSRHNARRTPGSSAPGFHHRRTNGCLAYTGICKIGASLQCLCRGRCRHDHP